MGFLTKKVYYKVIAYHVLTGVPIGSEGRGCKTPGPSTLPTLLVKTEFMLEK